MAEATFLLRIFTPQGMVLEAKVESAAVPGIDGELGILPEHTQYTGVLGAGMVQYQSSGQQKPGKVVVAGGFASFQANELVLLVDGVDFEADFAKIAVDSEAQALEIRLAELSAFDPEWSTTQQKLRRLEAIRAAH